MIKGNTDLFKRIILRSSLSSTGCWEWDGSTRNGYGRITVSNAAITFLKNIGVGRAPPGKGCTVRKTNKKGRKQ